MIQKICGICKTLHKGVIVQIPLPRPGLQNVLNIIPVSKDVDLLSNKSQKKFYSGDFTRLSPVVRAFEYFLISNHLDVKSKKCDIIGNGFLVGRLISAFLLQRGAKVRILDKAANERRINYEHVSNFNFEKPNIVKEPYSKGKKLNSQFVVLSAGVPNLVDGSDISEGANVLDFGSNLLNGRYVGDLDMNSKLDHLSIISPSPGGMGPPVLGFLIVNLLGI